MTDTDAGMIGSFLKGLKLWEKAKIQKRHLTTKIKAGKNSTVNVYINDNYNALPLDKDVEPHSDALFDEGFEFYREDLIEEEIVRDAELSVDEVLTKMKKVMDIEHYKMLKSASLITYYDGKGEEEKAMKIFKIHIKRFDETGKRIYNLLESKFFNFLFIPFLEELESYYQNKQDEINSTFQELFNEFLRYNPIAIWVTNKMDIKNIQLKIMSRLVAKNQKGMYVFGRGKKNIDKIEDAIDGFIQEYEHYEVYKKERKIRKLKACEFYIIDLDELDNQ